MIVLVIFSEELFLSAALQLPTTSGGTGFLPSALVVVQFRFCISATLHVVTESLPGSLLNVEILVWAQPWYTPLVWVNVADTGFPFIDMRGCGLPEAQQLTVKSSPTFTEDDWAVVKLTIRGETVKQRRRKQKKKRTLGMCRTWVLSSD